MPFQEEEKSIQSTQSKNHMYVNVNSVAVNITV